MIMNRTFTAAVFFTAALSFAGMARAAIEPAPAVAVSTAAAVQDYVYRGDKFRDPFIPLAGAGMMDIPTRYIYQEGEFDPTTIELKGILRTKTGRMALLRTNSGGIYIVKDGKILDYKRKAVAGYVGIVKEKSLVMIGPNNAVTELRWKSDEEKEKDKQ